MQTTRVVIQGITGREGRRAAEFMLRSGTKVLAGVTPGKGGQEVLGVPVFDTVAEARSAVGEFDATSIYVPARAVLPAAFEAIEHGVGLVHILAEGIPVRDKVTLAAESQVKGVALLGPGSLGKLTVGEGRIGMVGGPDPSAYKPGGVSIISRSGGMVNEIAHYLSKTGQGIRTMLHLGEEIIPGSTLIRELAMLQSDPLTERIVLFDEITGTSANFRALEEYLHEHGLHKPLVMTLAGSSQRIMPEGIPFGHAEVLLRKHGDDIADRKKRLTRVGVTIVDSYEQFI